MNAPHLPEDNSPSRIHYPLLSMILVAAIIAGFVGGLYAMKAVLPGILERFTAAIPVPPISETTPKNQDVTTEFAGMVRVTRALGRTSDDTPHGYALGFTSDGWLITTKTALDHNKFVFDENGSHRITATIVDSASDAVYVKTDATGWSVPQVNESFVPTEGDTVYVVTPTDGVVTAHVASNYGILDAPATDAEHFDRVVFLDRTLSLNFSGAPVFTSQGTLVGIVLSKTTSAGNATVLPQKAFVSSFRHAATEGKVTYAFLGVRVASFVGSHVDLSHEPSGAVILSSKTKGAGVKPNSPAAAAGLKDNDRIVSIEGSDLGRSRTLSDALLSYRPGQKISLTYERDGHRTTVSIVLGATPL